MMSVSKDLLCSLIDNFCAPQFFLMHQIGFSNSPGFIQVVPYPDYSRKFENHVVSCCGFTDSVMAL